MAAQLCAQVRAAAAAACSARRRLCVAASHSAVCLSVASTIIMTSRPRPSALCPFLQPISRFTPASFPKEQPLIIRQAPAASGTGDRCHYRACPHLPASILPTQSAIPTCLISTWTWILALSRRLQQPQVPPLLVLELVHICRQPLYRSCRIQRRHASFPPRLSGPFTVRRLVGIKAAAPRRSPPLCRASLSHLHTGKGPLRCPSAAGIRILAHYLIAPSRTEGDCSDARACHTRTERTASRSQYHANGGMQPSDTPHLPSPDIPAATSLPFPRGHGIQAQSPATKDSVFLVICLSIALPLHSSLVMPRIPAHELYRLHSINHVCHCYATRPRLHAPHKRPDLMIARSTDEPMMRMTDIVATSACPVRSGQPPSCLLISVQLSSYSLLCHMHTHCLHRFERPAERLGCSSLVQCSPPNMPTLRPRCTVQCLDSASFVCLAKDTSSRR